MLALSFFLKLKKLARKRLTNGNGYVTNINIINERVALKHKENRMAQVVMTRGIADKAAESSEFAKFLTVSLHRFISSDWGDTAESDKPLNDRAVKAWKEKDEDNYDRLLAVYKTDLVEDGKIWIIEEWDRSYITILFPSEY